MSREEIKDGLNSRQRWYLKNRERHSALNLERQRKLREAVLVLLGHRCASPECRWLNADGTLGCTDSRGLQVDHIGGGGGKEIKTLGYYKMCRKILSMENPEIEYQILCATCNWIKRQQNNEMPGKGPRKRVWDEETREKLTESISRGNSVIEQQLRTELVAFARKVN